MRGKIMSQREYHTPSIVEMGTVHSMTLGGDGEFGDIDLETTTSDETV